MKSKPEPAVEPRDCEYAQKFAQATAKSMRDGYVSSDIFKLYGGIDSLSKGSINIINYVYTYRTTENVSVERIAELTVSQCQTGAIENASCEDLPLSFTDRIGGCDVEEKLAEKPADVIGPDTSAQTEPASDSDGDATDSHQANIRSADTASQCKERYQTEIDNIDNRMRSGYSSSQGERLREQRRDLREKIRQC